MTADYVRSIDLDSKRSIRVRAANAGDVDQLLEMYRRMSPMDRQRRFFSVVVPHRDLVESWVTMKERPGAIGLVAELFSDAESPRIIGEAGCSPLPDGDAELGISIDPDHRGWGFGSWLLDTLVQQAADRGIANIQALVAVDNKQMRKLLSHRGAAAMPSQDYSTARFTISTTGCTPSWPPNPDGKRRLLVESERSRWFGTKAAQAKGYDVIVCAGPSSRRGQCPVVEGESCPLVLGADEVLLALNSSEDRQLLAEAHRQGQRKPFLEQESDSTDAALAAVEQLPESDD